MLRTLVQFFAIPFLIVCVAVGLMVTFTFLFGGGPETAADFVELLQSDTINRRTQAAYELAQRLSGGVPAEFRDPKLVSALGGALDKARAENQKPPHQACMILTLLARLADPVSIEAVRRALDDKHPWVRSYAIFALPALGDRESIPRLREFASDEDPGTRRAALDALAKFDRVEGLPFRLSKETREIALRHLGDENVDVRFTAAIVMARARQREAALPVLKHMLSREYLGQFELDDRQEGYSLYQIHSNVIRAAITAVTSIECGDDPKVIELLKRLTDDDVEGDPDVRQAAREALSQLAGKKN
ncbi:MAG: HEAT repeat domain-containing protein [Planctomycetota bacterium]